MKDGFVRIAAATPALRVADCAYNAEQTISLARRAADEGAAVVVFPELGLTGYTCGDLFLSQTLLEGADNALDHILEETAALNAVLLVGLPVRCGAALYNCAAVMTGGKLLGLIPKTYLPNYAEFYEARHFSSGKDVDEEIVLAGQTVRLCARQIFCCRQLPDFMFGAEICEDLWVPSAPSENLAAAGATLICNLSASDELIGKMQYRRQLVCGQSGRLICAYVYADAGQGESSQDMVFAGHNLIAENGSLLAESRRFETGLTFADADLSRLATERRRTTTYPKSGCAARVPFDLVPHELALRRTFSPTPFVPQSRENLAERCEEILALQAEGLCTRLRHTHCQCAVVGLSGGLDSTLALIVMVHAFDRLGLDRKGILAVTMPCFGTTKRTKSNAVKLAEAYGVTLRQVDITASVTQHFADIGQDMDVHDVTYENGQARERTQVLMDLANKCGGLVVGTGDLSELALGWATYNGDHMSMYAVNCSIPKTLVRHLTAYEAGRSEGDAAGRAARHSCHTRQPRTAAARRMATSPSAPRTSSAPMSCMISSCIICCASALRRAKSTVCAVWRWTTATTTPPSKNGCSCFLRRFFAQQFKRSCLPDGAKVGTVTLSPRGDWRMPSDAVSALWLHEAEQL